MTILLFLSRVDITVFTFTEHLIYLHYSRVDLSIDAFRQSNDIHQLLRIKVWYASTVNYIEFKLNECFLQICTHQIIEKFYANVNQSRTVIVVMRLLEVAAVKVSCPNMIC